MTLIVLVLHSGHARAIQDYRAYRWQKLYNCQTASVYMQAFHPGQRGDIIYVIFSSKAKLSALHFPPRPMMVITQKITSLAFEIHDGRFIRRVYLLMSASGVFTVFTTRYCIRI